MSATVKRYDDDELVRLYEEYWVACQHIHADPRRSWLRYRQGTAALIADRIVRYHA